MNRTERVLIGLALLQIVLQSAAYCYLYLSF